MRKNKHLALVVASIFLATLWGCGSNMDSGGDQTGPGTEIADAAKLGSSSCKVCHTTVAVTENFNGSVHDNDSVAGCEGCHGGGQFHKGIGQIAYPEPGPNQCTQCHTLSAIGHTDDPATATIIEGLVVKMADNEGCQACHYNDHNPVLTINREWANSAHGGHIATGPVTSATGDAWLHYDWDKTLDGSVARSGRGDCQRCHTSTGVANFLGAKIANTTYSPANNDFSHLSGWAAATGSGQNELLYCWGCHSDVSTGEMRNPGAITEVYPGVGTAAPSATVTYPDVTNSNLCMACHIGRQVGQNIADSTGDFTNLAFINSHYLAAGGEVFNESGYEYAGPTYDNLGYHKNVGVGNLFNTGNSGPCVSCHMSVDSGHTFKFLDKDVDGTILENNSTMCNNCHIEVSPEALETAEENFQLALEELELALEARGFYFAESYPYFFKTAGNTDRTNGVTDWTVGGALVGKDAMGAAFNFNLLKHDPGAYVHNNDYALKLIADSIDYLNDGLLDGDASLAKTLISQGMNLESGAGYSPIHDTPVAIAVGAQQTSGGTCSACHAAAPHYGGAVGIPQWVNTQANCAHCHASNDPSLNGLIISQYAHSGHGDVAGIWTNDEGRSNATLPASNPSNCQRCHNTSGYIASLSGTTFAFPASPSAARFQVLNCNACHPSVGDGTATYQTPGAFSVTWSANAVNQLFTFPDASTSNICIRCHSGRRGGPQITNDLATYPHYLPAAAGLYGRYVDPAAIPAINNASGIGFEFIGAVGAGVYGGINPHTQAGLSNLNGTGSRGPCVACHMSGSAGHTWEPLEKDHLTGDISAINSSACAQCHDGNVGPGKAATLGVAGLQAEYNQFVAARNVLKAALEAKGLYFLEDDHTFRWQSLTGAQVFGGNSGNDYSYIATILASFPYLNTADTFGRKYVMGAAYNYSTLTARAFDPAMYAHNPLYAKRLIFDSIDFLDNGVLDGSIIVTGDAATYFGGTTRP